MNAIWRTIHLSTLHCDFDFEAPFSLLYNIIEAMFLSLRLWSSLLQTHVALVGTAYLICLQDMYVIYN